MLAIYATALLILGASLLIGRTICGVVGWPRPICEPSGASTTA